MEEQNLLIEVENEQKVKAVQAPPPEKVVEDLKRDLFEFEEEEVSKYKKDMLLG